MTILKDTEQNLHGDIWSVFLESKNSFFVLSSMFSHTHCKRGAAFFTGDKRICFWKQTWRHDYWEDIHSCQTKFGECSEGSESCKNTPTKKRFGVAWPCKL